MNDLHLRRVDDAIILLFLLIQGDVFRMDECMSAWRYVRKDTGTNWNSLSMKRNLVKDDCYLNTTMTKWVEESVGLTDHAAIRCKKDFLTALNMFLHKLPHHRKSSIEYDLFFKDNTSKANSSYLSNQIYLRVN